MTRLTDIIAIACILILAAIIAAGVAMQLELLRPGVQHFLQTDSGPGWTLYPPLSPGLPDGQSYTAVAGWHRLLGMALLFLTTILAALLHGSRRAVVFSGLSAALWLGAIAAAMATLMADRNFGTAFFDPTGNGTPVLDALLLLSADQTRPSVWPLLSAAQSIGALSSETALDPLLALYVLGMAAAPLIALVVLTVCVIRLPRGAFWVGALAALLGVLLTAVLAVSDPLRGTKAETALAHAGLGLVAIFVLGFLLVRWLASRDRPLPGWLIALFAVAALGPLGLALRDQYLLGGQGMPRLYLDYPFFFAPLAERNALRMLVLAGVLTAFLLAAIVRRLSAARPDEVSEIF